MTQFLIAYMAPLMFAALVVFLLFGYPVSFALAAIGLSFGFLGIELGLLTPALFGALPERIFGIMSNMRSGKAPNSAGVSRPSSIPRKPNDSPIAANANETG